MEDLFNVSKGSLEADRWLSALLASRTAAMRLVSEAGGRLRRAAEEEEKERPAPPSHHSNHQFSSMKSKFFNELTHLPSEHIHTHTHTQL